MHSSRMRTTRSLTVSRHILCTPWQPHMPPQQPCMPPPHHNHACPPTTMHVPSNHACPPTTMHTPHNQTCPEATMHTLGNLTCPPPATWHPPATTHAPVDRMTHTCKNITLPQTSFAGAKYYIVWSWSITCRIQVQLTTDQLPFPFCYRPCIQTRLW